MDKNGSTIVKLLLSPFKNIHNRTVLRPKWILSNPLSTPLRLNGILSLSTTNY